MSGKRSTQHQRAVLERRRSNATVPRHSRHVRRQRTRQAAEAAAVAEQRAR